MREAMFWEKAGGDDVRCNLCRFRCTIAPNTAWPSVQSRAEAVQVTFTCGYGDTSDTLPPPIREAILSNIVSIWENKPISGSPLGGEDIVFQRLLNQHRMPDDWFNYG